MAAKIKTEKEYEAAMNRINELLPYTWEDSISEDSAENIELSLLSELVADYEDEHYPIEKPSLISVLRLRMYEMGLSQKGIAELLGISAPRMSEIMHGKIEPSLSLARKICIKLNIAPDVVLGL
ncbi:MAG: helix-turn-helix domain-containing protein [Paludibacteraceae bacterium]|nr:helix-turn-helix domain-containing protein [Paludibacteraceae bacterium]